MTFSAYNKKSHCSVSHEHLLNARLLFEKQELSKCDMINKYDGSNWYIHMEEQGQRVKMNQPEVSSQSQI